MKPAMLLIGGATPRMMKKFNELFEVRKFADVSNVSAWLAGDGQNIEAIATNGHDGVPEEILLGCPKLKIVSCYGVGYDNINAAKAAENGIVVTHTPSVLNAEVSSTAIMLMLAVSRNLFHDNRWLKSGDWAKYGEAPLSQSIDGTKVGILGLGRIGEAIADKLQAFSCEVSYHSRNKRDDVNYRYYDSLEAMAGDVDFLIAITPGGASTNKLISTSVLEALGPEGTLINVGRGSVVDEAALIDALKNGKIRGAGLDVFEREPHVPQELQDMENVVLLPHVGSATVQTRQAMGDLTVENLEQYFSKGTIISPVPECKDVIG